MMLYNNIIINHDLVEIPPKGRSFTWSNMQESPLLEKLGWIFTSANWTNDRPSTLAFPLAKISYDHVPIKIQIDSKIPKCNIFIFEEFRTELMAFVDTVQNHWNNIAYFADFAKNIVSKFKSHRRSLKAWSKRYSQQNKTIDFFAFM